MEKGVQMDNNTRWQDFNSIIDNEELNLKEKGLLLAIFRYVNYKTGYADPSRTLIKKITGIKEDKTLNKLFNSIIEKGFLIRESGKGIRSKYFIKVEVKNAPQKENKKKIKEYIDLSFIDDVIDKVKITKEQYDKLVDKFNIELVHSQILGLDNYIANGKGAKYKDHYRVLNTWCNKKYKEEENIRSKRGIGNFDEE